MSDPQLFGVLLFGCLLLYAIVQQSQRGLRTFRALASKYGGTVKSGMLGHEVSFSSRGIGVKINGVENDGFYILRLTCSIPGASGLHLYVDQHPLVVFPDSLTLDIRVVQQELPRLLEVDISEDETFKKQFKVRTNQEAAARKLFTSDMQNEFVGFLFLEEYKYSVKYWRSPYRIILSVFNGDFNLCYQRPIYKNMKRIDPVAKNEQFTRFGLKVIDCLRMLV